MIRTLLLLLPCPGCLAIYPSILAAASRTPAYKRRAITCKQALEHLADLGFEDSKTRIWDHVRSYRADGKTQFPLNWTGGPRRGGCAVCLLHSRPYVSLAATCSKVGQLSRSKHMLHVFAACLHPTPSALPPNSFARLYHADGCLNSVYPYAAVAFLKSLPLPPPMPLPPGVQPVLGTQLRPLPQLEDQVTRQPDLACAAVAACLP
jgi:hypothetical protein